MVFQNEPGFTRRWFQQTFMRAQTLTGTMSGVNNSTGLSPISTIAHHFDEHTLYGILTCCDLHHM